MKHCPECNVEYHDTAIRCSDCDVELTLGPPIPPIQEEHPDPKIETVYATGDPALVTMVKSLLEECGNRVLHQRLRNSRFGWYWEARGSQLCYWPGGVRSRCQGCAHGAGATGSSR